MRRQPRMVRRHLAWLLLLPIWAAVGLAGATPMPAVSQPASRPADSRPEVLASQGGASVAQRLKDHVYLLAKPALKGRSPGTLGSQRARQYIIDRFQECGLRPWAGADGYELPFEGGTNVVGVLPGSDPLLADRFVLVTAHYDHVGLRDGKVYPGATDNASGVAAVLEIARRLSSQPVGPKRSIAFCGFDCEERGLVGSKKFVRRADFPKRRIDCVVNIDMLGHEGIDDQGYSLLDLGSQGGTGVMQSLRQAAAREHVRLRPVSGHGGSDHATFRDLNIPYLFFCCGAFEGFHEPADTADRLNYDNMEREVAVIAGAVRALAERPQRARITVASRPAATRPGPAEQAVPLPF